MQQTTLYLIDALIVACFAIGFMAWLFGLKRKYQLEARDKVRVEFRTPEGSSWSENIAVTDGIVELIPKHGKHHAKAFVVNDESTYLTRYPEGWCPSYLQTSMRKALIRTDTMEAISRLAYTPIMTPEMLYDVRNQSFGAVAVIHSQIESQDGQKLLKANKQSSPSKLVWMFLILLAVGLIGIGYYMYTNFDVFKKALGIG